MSIFQSLLIVLMSVAAAIAYGIAHDQVTVRICLEYFTIGHEPVFPTRNPTLLAIGWGIIAGWACFSACRWRLLRVPVRDRNAPSARSFAPWRGYSR